MEVVAGVDVGDSVFFIETRLLRFGNFFVFFEGLVVGLHGALGFFILG